MSYLYYGFKLSEKIILTLGVQYNSQGKRTGFVQGIITDIDTKETLTFKARESTVRRALERILNVISQKSVNKSDETK